MLQAQYIKRATDAVANHFASALQHNPRMGGEVQGFQEYQFLGFTCRSPIDLKNLLEAKFSRNFQPTLISAINDIKSSEAIKKHKLHRALLNKYFGIVIDDDSNTMLEPNLQPSAYTSLPNENEDDFSLHLFFLQPFLLFNIKADSRKYISSNFNTQNREWLWHNNQTGTDSAPLFRKIIQSFILSEILQDYEENNNEFFDTRIDNNLAQLKALHHQLLQDVGTESDALFKNCNQPYIQDGSATLTNAELEIQGDPFGFYPNGRTIASELLPGILDVTNFYAIGRLAYGQPRVEPHRLLASRNLNMRRHPIKYGLNWISAHLNLTTSIFAIKLMAELCKSSFRALKAYATDPSVPLVTLVFHGLAVIPSAFILVASPLLIVFPWVFGLTSIPFTLMRTFCLHGPFSSLRHYNALKAVDLLDAIKDISLCTVYMLPLMGSILATINLVIPAPLLTLGLCVSLIFTIALIREGDYELAASPFGRLFGLAVSLGFAGYLSLGVISRFMLPRIPQEAITLLRNALHYLSFISRPLQALSHSLLSEDLAYEVNGIIPSALRQPAMTLPKRKFPQFPEEMLLEVNQLRSKLGKLNSAFHFSPERKTLFRACLVNLEITEHTTQASLNHAIKCANKLIKNNFDAGEIAKIRALITTLETDLPESDSAFLGPEKAALRVAENTGAYQPSWKLLQTLEARGNFAVSENVTPQMLKKCGKIKAQQHRA